MAVTTYIILFKFKYISYEFVLKNYKKLKKVASNRYENKN